VRERFLLGALRCRMLFNKTDGVVFCCTCCIFIVIVSHFTHKLSSLFWFQDRQNAQASCAGLFVAAHLGFDYPGVWMHVDMATPVHCVSNYHPKSHTHQHTRILTHYHCCCLSVAGGTCHRLWCCIAAHTVWQPHKLCPVAVDCTHR